MDIVNEQLSTTCTAGAAAVHVSEPTLNPFRSPIRKHNLQPTAVPAFSNAVIFHLQYRWCLVAYIEVLGVTVCCCFVNLTYWCEWCSD